MGVWIETRWGLVWNSASRKSHPSWVCGLKQGYVSYCVYAVVSHPSWVCGLKPLFEDWIFPAHQVTPFVGVWIETQIAKVTPHPFGVTPFVGVWIETSMWTMAMTTTCRHTLRGCVDWNNKMLQDNPHAPRSHPSWVCGLKLRVPYGTP